MPLKYFTCFNHSINANSYAEKEFSFKTDVKVKRIFINERSGLPLNDVLFYLKVSENVYTRDYAPATLFGEDPLTAQDLDITITAKETVYYKVDNKKSTAINVDVCFMIAD